MKTKQNATFSCLLVMVLATFGSALAGDLEPPGPPASTMVTLQQIYDKACAPADVAKTGQTGCWNASGTSVSCTGTGQDGEYQLGVAVAPRFTDSGDGTVKDNLTGLIWLKDANCFGLRNWTSALSDANTLADGSCGLTDGSAPGSWRLPNIKELEGLIDFGQYNPALAAGHPFAGVQSADYWSSSTRVNAIGPNGAWFVWVGEGIASYDDKLNARYVWPVRGGQ